MVARSIEELHGRALIVDGMGGDAHAFELQKSGGVTAINVTIAYNEERMEDVLRNIYAYLNLVETCPADTTIIESVACIEAAKRAGKVGIILGTQGLAMIDRGLHWIALLQRLGVRISGLVYNEPNWIGSSCTERVDSGLTYFGRQVVNEMNRRGVVIDLSHTGDRSSLDAVEISQHPVVISHSNIRRLVEHPRNAPDDLIKAVAARGGVIGLTQYSALLDTGGPDLPTMKEWLDHFRYAVDLVGIDHVGVGTDGFDGTFSWRSWLRYMLQYRELVPARYLEPEYANMDTHNLQGWSSNADMRKLTEGLSSLNYSDEDIEKVLGLNFIRVYQQVWRDK
jgi:membrane dipeptidase